MYLFAWIVIFFAVAQPVAQALDSTSSSCCARRGRTRLADDSARASARAGFGLDAPGSRAGSAGDAADGAADGACGDAVGGADRGAALTLFRAARVAVWAMADRNLVCMLIAAGIGCWPALQAELREGGLRWVNSLLLG